eukprot:1294911-Pyramimonas_sp.AAC.1
MNKSALIPEAGKRISRNMACKSHTRILSSLRRASDRSSSIIGRGLSVVCTAMRGAYGDGTIAVGETQS